MQVASKKNTSAKKQSETKKPSVEIRTPVSNKPSLVSREKIAERAFSLWQSRGFMHGDDQHDWYTAERELLNR